MRVADYIFKTLADRGVKHAFLVVGGGAMQLNDALRLETRITPVCCHHEQGCAIAAEGYFRASGNLPVVSVTTGPGGTNALTGVIGAWLDSIPMLVISGQVKFETTTASCPQLGLRQLGDQEINIIDIVKPVTKYAAMVTDPNKIGEMLARALHEATTGRPGPVWLDIPLNVQGALIDESTLPQSEIYPDRQTDNTKCYEQFVHLLSKSKRPVVIAGHGIELDHMEIPFRDLIESKEIPVLTTFNGMNILPTDHPFNFGRIGTIGHRAANFILQAADLVISIASRNNIRQISYNWENFAKNAKKVIVDIDHAELFKPTIHADIPIEDSAKNFIVRWAQDTTDCARPNWLTWCKQRREKYPFHTPDQAKDFPDGVNPYHFLWTLTQACPSDVNIVAGNGTACVALFQTCIVKERQKIFWNSGCASMGYDIPAALGAAVATNRTTLCIAGDGSAMMNLQELETIIYRQLPVKIILLANDGYCSIRQTQKNFFSPELMGCGPTSGVGFPDFIKLAKAFGFQTSTIDSHLNLAEKCAMIFEDRLPHLCLVKVSPGVNFSPKLSARRLPDGKMISPALDDMFPFLSKEELESNRIQDASCLV